MAYVKKINGNIIKDEEARNSISTLESKSHTHNNKSVLDSITQAKINAWDAGTGSSGGTGSNNASDITIADANNNYSSANVEGALNEIANSIKNFVSSEGITSYDTFPSDTILNAMAMDTVFEVRGFYNVGDMPRCAYQKVSYGKNAIKKTGYYIKPVSFDNVLFLPQVGIRQGAAYASQNSSILENNIEFDFTPTLKLPVGD